MADRLASMATFVRVAELGSFAAAADALGLSAAMAGRHVAGLEARLGVRLITRNTRRQSLTDDGAAFLDRCRVILAEVEAAEAGAATSRAAPTGRLRVDAPVTFGACRLAPALPAFLATNPGVTLDLTLNNRNVDLVEEGFDAVIRVGPLGDSTLVARALAPYRLAACAAPIYLAARGAPATVAGLADHECLGFGSRRGEWTFVGPDGATETARVAGRYSANNGQALRAVALAGLGVILQPEALLADDLAEGRLVRVLPFHRPPALPMHLLFAPGRRMAPKLRAFVDFVSARFGL